MFAGSWPSRNSIPVHLPTGPDAGVSFANPDPTFGQVPVVVIWVPALWLSDVHVIGAEGNLDQNFTKYPRNGMFYAFQSSKVKQWLPWNI